MVLLMMAPLTAGCGKKKSTTVVASCNRPGKLCTDYYVEVEAVVRSACTDTHGGTWADGKACDRKGAVVGCHSGDSVVWSLRGEGETEASVKEYVGRLCINAGEKIVTTDWKPTP